MYAERLGSYSIAATFAGTPSLRRLKSMRRYRRLAPPPPGPRGGPPPWPRWRGGGGSGRWPPPRGGGAVWRLLVLRPPLFVSPSTRLFSGSVFVTSAKSG